MSMKEMIAKIAADQKKFFRSGATKSVAYRKQSLKKLLAALQKFENEIFEALAADLGKPAFEAFTSETLLVEKEIKNMLKICNSLLTFKLNSMNSKDIPNSIGLYVNQAIDFVWIII